MQNDRNLLFGILAMQMDFVSREQLIAAVSAWMLEKATPLAEILLRQQAIRSDERDLLEALVSKHLAKHNNDPAQSLAAVSSIGSVGDELKNLGDANFNASLAIVASNRTPEPDRWATRSFSVGETTSAGTRFRILRPHAEGGLGVVSVARDEELGREVALKEIKSHHADNPDSRSRFLLEAEITGRLEHPGIVPVYGLGQYADGRPFFAMRFIRGDSLKEAADRYHDPKAAKSNQGERAVELRKLLGRFLDVCNAIAYAHSRGILHRDLKPGNIMLGHYGETLVVDWGLAKPMDRPEPSIDSSQGPLKPSAGSGSAPTLMGSAVGTPRFMSPEQAAGRLDLLGAASDVYSLGATLYYVLTGKPPIEADDVGVVLKKVQKGDFRPPRARNPEIARPLEAICLKAMALNPVDRYATPRALAEDIERWLADEPVRAHPDPLLARVARTARQHKVVTATAAALLVAAVLALSVGTVFLGREQARTQKARRDAEDNFATAERSRAEAVAEKTQAKKQLLRSEWLLYASQINSAQRAWETNDASLAWDHLEATRWDFRGWEYNYLFTLFNQNQKTLKGHTDWVTSVAFSPDGKRIVSGSDDKTLKVWDAASGQETLTLKGHTDEVSSVAFSPDGKRIASGSRHGTLKVWDAGSGQESLSLKGHKRSVDSVAFSPDGKRIVSGSWDTLKVWDAASGQESLTLKGHMDRVSSVAFSPDGKQIFSDGVGTLTVWDAGSGRETLTLKGHTDEVSSVAFSPDGKRIASGSNDGTIKVWDAGSGQETLTLKGHTDWVISVAFSLDGKRIASGSRDNTLKVWDAGSGQVTFTLKGHAGLVMEKAFGSFIGDTDRVSSVAFSPDGKRIVSGSDDKTLKVWDAGSGQESFTLKGHTDEVSSVAFSPDGKRIVSGSHDKMLKVWNAASGQETLTLKGHTDNVSSVAFSPDGKRIVSGSDDKTLKVWNAASGQETLTLKGHTGKVFGVAFSPDGKRIVSGSNDTTLKIWDAASGEEMLTLKGHRGWVSSVAFSPDGKRIASGSTDKTLKVWDAASGQEMLTLRGHSSYLSTVTFSPDGKRIVSGSWDKALKVWDAANGQETLTLKGHTEVVHSVAFSPDGKRIVSASWDGTLKVWDASSGPLQ